MYVGRYRPDVPTSDTRDPNPRDHLLSFVRCPRVETALAAAANGFVLNLDQSIFSVDFRYIFPCQSIRLTQTESQWPDGGLIRR